MGDVVSVESELEVLRAEIEHKAILIAKAIAAIDLRHLNSDPDVAFAIVKRCLEEALKRPANRSEPSV